MIRPALVAPALLMLAACGKAAVGSDGLLPDSADLVTAGEAAAAFNQCKVCHTTEAGKHLVGPSLAGVYGRRAGTAAGYPSSAAMRASSLTWDEATLNRFLAAPMKVVPGTRMTYAGISDPAARREVIAHMKTL